MAKEGRSEARLRCVCGYSIRCEVRSEGERLGFVAFFDDELMSENYGQQVNDCPGCAQRVGLDTLMPKTPS
jgi:hypothetical protein